MKTAPARAISAGASSPPRPKRMRKTNVVLRKLSLKAAKNWQQNNGAKRRDKSSGMTPRLAQVPPQAASGLAFVTNEKGGPALGRLQVCSAVLRKTRVEIFLGCRNPRRSRPSSKRRQLQP